MTRTSQALQTRQQREAEQHRSAKQEAQNENPEAAAPSPRPLFDSLRLGRLRRRQRVLALDHAAGDIIGDGIDDRRHVARFRKHDAAIASVLQEAIDALVASHHHMRNHVEPEPRRLTIADATLEQVDIVGHLRKQRIELLVQDFEPGDLGVTEIDDHAGAIGGLDPRLVKRITQANRTRLARGIASSVWSGTRSRTWRLGHRTALTLSITARLA